MKKTIKVLSTMAFMFSAMSLAACNATPHEHSFGEWTVETAATCTVDGVEARTCECGEKETRTITATGHNYVYSEIVWTDYTAKAVYVCSHDATHKEEHACTVTSETTKNPTCTEDGSAVYTATYDGHTSTKSGSVAKLNHDWKFDSITWYGVTAKATYVCNRNSEHKEERNCTVTHTEASGVTTYTASIDGHTSTKVVKEFAFTAGDGDAAYLQTGGNSGNGGTHRWADNNNYYTYLFDFGASVDTVRLEMFVQNDTKIDVSYNGTTFYEVANSKTENANDCGRYFSNVATVKEFETYTNTGKVYVKFSDAVPEDGFGADLYGFKVIATFGDGKEAPVVTEKTVEFTVANDDAYLDSEYFGGKGAGADKRFVDEDHWFIYAIDFGQEVSAIELDLVIENESKVEISYGDKASWNEVMNSITENANGCGRYYGNVTTTRTITTYANTGKVYLKFSDADTSNGFGCCLYSFKAIGTFGEGQEIPTDNTVEFAVTNDDAYLDSEYFGGKDAGADKRFVDNDHWFIYKIDFEQEVSQIELSLVIENQSKVEVSYDGKTTWTEVMNSVTEDANGCGKYFGNVTTTRTITTLENDGVVYFRFSDADTSDGFGCCLYSFKAVGTFGEGQEAAPTEKTIEFTVTNDDSYLDSEYFGGKGAGADKRFVDEDHWFIYKIDFEAEVASIVLSLVIENQSKVEVSYDGKTTWTEIMNSVTEDANGCGKYYGNVTTTKTITASDNNGVVYFRFSDADTSDGFGCCLYSFKAVAALA